jgi:hypothetical protein
VRGPSRLHIWALLGNVPSMPNERTTGNESAQRGRSRRNGKTAVPVPPSGDCTCARCSSDSPLPAPLGSCSAGTFATTIKGESVLAVHE